MGIARGLLRTLRPHQWVKNLFFVGAPLVFAKRLWDREAVVRELLAVAIFCAVSSAVYALNDVVDVEKDRAHPTKKRRPVASGALPVGAALAAAAVLGLGGLVGAWLLNPAFAAVAAVYLVQNVAYSLRLKQVPWVDVAVLSAGFLLRVLGGAYAIHVPASRWLMACTVLLAAFLGFGKRSHELNQASSGVASSGSPVGITRKVLSRYRAHHLVWALRILGATTIVCYSAYTVAPHTVAFFGTWRLVLTTPFCAFGIYRFLKIVTRKAQVDSPTEEMLRDWPFMANLALWGAAVLLIIYFHFR